MRAEPVSNSEYATISELHLISCEYRAAVFDVTGCKTTETPSVILFFFYKIAWQFLQ